MPEVAIVVDTTHYMPRALVEANGVHSTFNRTNGCEIERWDALAPVLELPG